MNRPNLLYGTQENEEKIMDFRETVWAKAKAKGAHIVLPESLDIRMHEAACKILKEGLAREVTFVGNLEEIRELSEREGTDISLVNIVDCEEDGRHEEFVRTYYALRKHKGITLEDARAKIREPLVYGALMVRAGSADGMVVGAVNSTADVLRTSLAVIGAQPGIRTVSSSMVMIVREKSFGLDGHPIFADCGMVPSPDSRQLAEIAMASAQTARKLIGAEPCIAMLSFSTKGSAEHESVDRVREGLKIVREQSPDLLIDGELQLDAALVKDVADKKCPESPVGGRVNVLIFPDLNAGNIGYKLVQRFGGAEAYGPILQGLARPVNDLSRGCSSEDIVNVVAITAAQTA